MSGLWVKYSEDPRKVMHNRFKLQVWISTLHWNTAQFRSGESEDSSIGKSKENAKRKLLTEEEQARFDMLFKDLVTRAREMCLPRMQARQARKKDAAALLRQKILKQREKNMK